MDWYKYIASTQSSITFTFLNSHSAHLTIDKPKKMCSKIFGVFMAIVLMAVVSNIHAASLNQPFEFEIDPVGKYQVK